MVVVEILVLPYVSAVRHDSSKVLTLGFRFLAKGSFPIFKLELTRIVRRKRIQAALAVAYHNIDPFLRSAFFENTILVSAIIVSYIPLLSRGISDGTYPYAMLAGVNPYRWCYAIVFSSFLVVFLVSIPVLIYWSVLANNFVMIFSGLGIIFFTSTVGVIIGFIMKPSQEASGTETSAVLITVAITYVMGQVLKLFGQDTMLTAGIYMGLISLVLVHLPDLVESTRWKIISKISTKQEKVG